MLYQSTTAKIAKIEKNYLLLNIDQFGKIKFEKLRGLKQSDAYRLILVNAAGARGAIIFSPQCRFYDLEI
ncbi:MAG: hypothetical protein CTY34_03065 [Methylobacter sp.]|nr:MAG: hypothetical protein CTY34_03065 [Methylobacter sp.]PPD32121.1 MAG: hypothetical protein CTY18_11085 [Methylomonas sp.]